MCLFASAENGFHAANSMQKKIDSLPMASGAKRRTRIGFHAGPVIEEGGDVFGDTVNVAARMTGLAKGMQIMTTRSTVDALPTHLRVLTRNIAAVAVKGKIDDMTVCEVLWQQEGSLTMMVSGGPANRLAAGGELRLRHAAQELMLHSKHPSATMGRDPASDIVINDIKASRHHARIEKRRDKFFLADHSTNGTFVRFNSESAIILRREEIMLRGTGSILFGRTDAEGDGEGESVEFQVYS
jgi:adenylate cyclase